MDQNERSLVRDYIRAKHSYTDPVTGCWFVKYNSDKSCYASGIWAGKCRNLHILSAVGFLNHNFGSILRSCHKCDVKACFNPEHLFLATDRENALDAVKKGRNKYRGKGETLNLMIAYELSKILDSLGNNHAARCS